MVDKPFDIDDLMVLVRSAVRSAPHPPVEDKDDSS
jgi:hypothetical protein